MKGISKSRYTTFCQCPKALWLRVNKPEEATVDAGVETRFEQGNVVGNLAMQYFGDFVEVTTKREDGSLDLAAMIQKTREEMQRGTDTICEASFSYLQEQHLENFNAILGDAQEPLIKHRSISNYCAVDILRKTAGGWAIYEVKSTSFPEFNEKPAKLEKYAPDIAYQKWVLEQCGVNVTGTYLVCLNSDYVRQGDLDTQELFVVKDMQELVANEYAKVAQRVRRAIGILERDEPDLDLDERCNKPYRCAFWEYCKRQHAVPEPSVFDVYGGSFKSKAEDRFFMNRKLALYREGKASFADLQNEPLGDGQGVGKTERSGRVIGIFREK